MSTIDDIRKGRLDKLQALKDKNIEAYPISSNQDYTNAEVIEKWTKLSEGSSAAGPKAGAKPTTLVGRVLALRPQGAIIFFSFDDGTAKFQGFMKKGEGISEDLFDLFMNVVDIGDFVEVTGTFFETKRGEKTIHASDWRMLSKSLRPLPEKWHGLQDVEERFRKRYLDVISSPEVKERFITRAKIVTELRKNLDKAGYLEVETPVLQAVAGGASAEPFKTHHNALDIDMYLRIAPELFLKELLVAGFPKVYEVGRLFRNEGIDVTHNPEFTTVEFYEAYSDAKKQQAFTEKLVRNIVKGAMGTTTITFDGQEIDFDKKFNVISFYDLLRRYALISNPESMSLDEAKLKAEQLGVKVERGDLLHKIFDNIYKKTCRPKLVQPTFIVEYPTAFSPLAKHKEGTHEFIDRFQLVIAGYELVNAFSELNDPLEQKKRFEDQEANKQQGDKEAQPNDDEYVEAMEHGMPPAGGVGMSVDRLTMILTNTKNIREVILFPTLKPRKAE